MIVKKITTGFVIQTYDTETGYCIEQNFSAGDIVEYEDEQGEPVDWHEGKDAYQPFDMVQPKLQVSEEPEVKINDWNVVRDEETRDRVSRSNYSREVEIEGTFEYDNREEKFK